MLRADLIQPRADYCLIQQEDAQSSPGGVLLPPSSTMARAIGLVLKVGPGLRQPCSTLLEVQKLQIQKGMTTEVSWYVPVAVKVGDRVLFIPPENAPNAPLDPDRIELGQSLFLIREHYLVAGLG
jgi:co-chaperonin GroES (HSP10)